MSSFLVEPGFSSDLDRDGERDFDRDLDLESDLQRNEIRNEVTFGQYPSASSISISTRTAFARMIGIEKRTL